MSDYVDYVEVNAKYSRLVMAFLKEKGLTPEQAFVILIYTAREIGKHNGITEEEMAMHLMTIERIKPETSQ